MSNTLNKGYGLFDNELFKGDEIKVQRRKKKKAKSSIPKKPFGLLAFLTGV